MKEKTNEPIDIRDFIGSVNDYSKNTPIEGGSQQTEGDIPVLPPSPHESPLPNEPNVQGEPIRRTTSKQRKASLDEYREQFLRTPKITDRQPVFVSRATRDSIDDVVRRLGERKMSVSGFLENLARHHLELYREDIEQWRKL